MAIPKFTGTAKAGKIVFTDEQKQYLSNYLLTMEGDLVVIQVKKWRPQRTLPQNAYLHAVVFGTIANETGNDLDTVKDTMKDMFATTVDAKGFRHTEKTSKMSTTRMAEFIEEICRFAAVDLNIYIPPPPE